MKKHNIFLIFLFFPLLSFGVYYAPASAGSSTGTVCTGGLAGVGVSCSGSSCPASGTVLGSGNIGGVVSEAFIYWSPWYYAITGTCTTGQPMPSCSSPSAWDAFSQTCKTPPLNTFDSDPSGCSKAGGYFMSTGTEQVGGTTYGASFFGGAGIQLGGSLKATTKCGTLGDLAGQMVTTALGLVPFASKLFGSDGLKKLSNIAWIDKMQKYNQAGGFSDLPSTPKGFNDTLVGLPKVNPTVGGKPSVPITESPVPSAIKSGDTSPTPTRAP